MVKYLFQSSYGCVLLGVFLLVFIFTDRSFEKRVRYMFSTAIIAVLLLVAADSIDYYLSEQTEFNSLRSLTTAMGYVLRPFTVYCIFLILRRRAAGKYIIETIPLALNTVVSFASIWTGWVFSFSADNLFNRGVMGILPFIVSGCYMLLLMAGSFFEFRRSGRGEMLMILFIGLASAFATAMETIFKMKFLLNETVLICLTAYYLFLHMQIYKRDALTNLLNRRNFFLDAKEHDDKEMYVVSIDMNNLKKINDEGGHQAGDAAILVLVEAIRSSLPKGAELYRVGGDEFSILSKKASFEELAEMVKKIGEKLEPTGYSASFGIAKYEPGMNFEAVCNSADEIMYENKRESKLGRADNHFAPIVLE